MPLDYYYRLSGRRQAVYRQSDEIVDIKLNDAFALRPTLDGLREALESDNLRRVQRAVDALAKQITDDLAVEPVKVKVRARRPRSAESELYGLYQPGEGEPSVIQVWMRTASRKQVVAYRTFLRTLIHEVCHHLDYTYLRLSETFHNEGFFKRESSLMRQLVPAKPKSTPRPEKPSMAKKPKKGSGEKKRVTAKTAEELPSRAKEEERPARPEGVCEQLELF